MNDQPNYGAAIALMERSLLDDFIAKRRFPSRVIAFSNPRGPGHRVIEQRFAQHPARVSSPS